MATFSGYFLVGIPDNIKSDKINVYTSTTSSGVFSLDNTINYTYPEKTVEYVIDEDKFYKISFSETSTGWLSPLSEIIYGSKIQTSTPPVTITSGSDGSSFATTDDVYELTKLTETDASVKDVKYALTMARAFIDLKTSNLSIFRFNSFDANTAKKKYNATIRILKDVEINYAASLIYRDLADNAILQNVIDGKSTSQSISVGATSIGGIEDSSSTTIANYLDALSTRYASYAFGLLNSVMPNYVPLRYSENGTGYKNYGWSYIYNYDRI